MTTNVTPVQRSRLAIERPPDSAQLPPPARRYRLRANGSAWIALVVGAVYAFLVTALWIPFGTRSGMGYETTLVYLSESHSLYDGFFYDGDPLRRFTQLFYQVGYQLSNLLGIDGSFLGYQLVYAALWWARGFLAFLVVRRLFPCVPLLAYAAGALVIVHASDHALNWVGQLNQFGVIFWMMLALYFLVVALQQPTPLRTAMLSASAAVATYLCLWSYESPLFILLLAPLLLLPVFGLSRRTGVVLGAYYLVPLLFVQKNLARYVGDDGATYQESVVRDDLAPTSLIGDLAYNVERSISFWRWDDGLPAASSSRYATFAGMATAAVFVSGTLLVWILTRSREDGFARRHAALLLGAGALLLLASFPAYLVLADARVLWRTQFLSGIGFGIGSAALLLLVASLIGNRVIRVLAIAGVGAAVAFAGGSSSYRTANWHYDVWQQHRLAIAQVLEIAPRVQHETVIVLTNVPADPGPFGHNMWFDVALRLAYPHTAVAGVYFTSDGRPAPGANLVVRGGAWVQEPTGFPTLLSGAQLSRTVVVRYSEVGAPTLMGQVPRFVTPDELARDVYDPRAVIVAGEPSPLAVRRYHPEDT